MNEQLLALPEGFEANAKLLRQLEKRRDALREGGIDWGQGEALAFASLLTEGIPIRLSGQDTERGTFSHRHAVLHDQRTGETFAPIQHLSDAGASFEIYNSPLSEYACLGFEYGYAVAAPDALVFWEAQFGDFVNGAQIVVDQFLVAGLSKWGQTSRLTLLLPHGYEGNGPEHSSAKLERFLQLAAQENIRVANCTNAAQYFHLVRRQALDATARPLVVMTPKGLLRMKQASSVLADLSEGKFEPVLDDPRADHGAVTRLVLCSGKIFYDIDGHEDRAMRHPWRSPGSSSSTRSRSSRPRRSQGHTRTCGRSCGPRRSLRTWEPGGRSATASRQRPPTTSRFSTSVVRGAQARARAIRPRIASSRTESSARRLGPLGRQEGSAKHRLSRRAALLAPRRRPQSRR